MTNATLSPQNVVAPRARVVFRRDQPLDATSVGTQVFRRARRPAPEPRRTVDGRFRTTTGRRPEPVAAAH